MKVSRMLKLKGYITARQLVSWMKYRDRYMFADLNIETDTRCNRKCSYCPNSLHKRPHRRMPVATFRKIIDELSGFGYTDLLTFSGYNEPTMDERLIGFLEYARSRLDCRMRIYTNGDFLGDWLPDACKLLKVKIIISDHDNGLKGTNLYNRGGLVDVRNCMMGASFCIHPLYKCIITAGGNITLCCNDYFEEVVLGSVKDGVMKVWKDTETIRKNISSGMFIDKIPLCRRCRSFEEEHRKGD